MSVGTVEAPLLILSIILSSKVTYFCLKAKHVLQHQRKFKLKCFILEDRKEAAVSSF